MRLWFSRQRRPPPEPVVVAPPEPGDWRPIADGVRGPTLWFKSAETICNERQIRRAFVVAAKRHDIPVPPYAGTQLVDATWLDGEPYGIFREAGQ